MATKAAHLQLVNVNQSALSHLAEDIEDFPEWVTIIAFYKALHLIEAVFATDERVRHTSDHRTRMRTLKQYRKYEQMYRHFRPLKAASEVARYLSDNESRSSYSSFRDYMPPKVVESEIIGHRLRRIERSADRLLKPGGPRN